VRWLRASRRPPATRPASATNSPISMPIATGPEPCSWFPARSRCPRSPCGSSPAARSNRRDPKPSTASSTPSRRRSSTRVRRSRRRSSQSWRPAGSTTSSSTNTTRPKTNSCSLWPTRCEEYRAVVAAGFVLQIDDPGLPDWWDMLKPEPLVEAYRQFARRRIAAVNHALAGIPEESVRYHLCWGSWHGPHTHDLPLEHIIDLILEVKAQTYSFEAANVRHEHEWRVWQNAKLPPGKMLMPGVVSHATNIVEH